MTDKDVIDYIWDKKNNFNSLYSKGKISQEMLDYLSNRYNDSTSLRESLYRIKHNLEIRPVCHICGAPVKFDGSVFKKACCPSHRIDQSKIKKAVKEKYGVDNISQLKEVKEKVKNTIINRYGVPNAFNIGKEKSITYRKEHKEEVRNKRINTCLERYGIEHVIHTESAKRNAHTEEANNKRRETCIRVYGVPNPVQNPKVLAKQWETKKIRGTFGGPHSQQENRIYEVLCKKYGKDNIERQYKDDERYPFYCDFYVKPLDLFIEYQGYFTHGTEPYDKDCIEHQNIVEELKRENHFGAIETWTIKDVEKRNTAKKNNLNYVEFFTLKEAIYRINNECYR